MFLGLPNHHMDEEIAIAYTGNSTTLKDIENVQYPNFIIRRCSKLLRAEITLAVTFHLLLTISDMIILLLLLLLLLLCYCCSCCFVEKYPYDRKSYMVTFLNFILPNTITGIQGRSGALWLLRP